MIEKNRSKINLITGIFYQAINTGMGLILPYLFITNFGSETNGLLSSIGQLFVYLELLEAGVGAAAQQALYKPITEKDRQGINRILSATHRYYVKAGGLYALLVVMAAFLFPYIITSSLSKVTIIEVVLLQGFGSVWSFFFQAKYVVFLRSEGKVYVLNGVNLATAIFRNLGKIVAIALGYDIIIVMIIQSIVYVIQSYIIVAYVRRKYPWIQYHEQPDFKAISQKNSVLLQSITWVIFNHTDVLLLAVVAKSLTLVSVYSIYTLIFESIQNLLETIRSGYFYKLGWKGQVSEKKLIKFYIKYENFYIALSSALFFIAYLFITPFLRLYVGGVTDTNYLLQDLPAFFLLLKILYSYRGLNKQLADAVGHFKKTQYINIIEMIVNILISLILVSEYNIYGVLLGSIIALIISDILYIRHNAKQVLKINCVHILIDILVYNCLGLFLDKLIGMHIPPLTTYRQLIIMALPSSITICSVFLISAIIIEYCLETLYRPLLNE